MIAMACLVVIILLLWFTKSKWSITTIFMERDNRMIRIGGGLHDNIWFIRLDLWWIGYRLSGK